MKPARRHLSTVTVAAATGVVTALVVSGGPALAASVVAYARNAGAVDGRHAVPANASVAARKGKLVATGAKSGQLPNDIIARAPNSDRLAGTPITGLATSFLNVHGPSTLTTTAAPICATAVYTPTTGGVATIEVVARAYNPDSSATVVAVTPAVSADGGATFTAIPPDIGMLTSIPSASFGSVSDAGTFPLTRGVHYAFASLGQTVGPSVTVECVLNVQLTPRLPGTRVTLSSAADTAAASTARTGSAAPHPTVRR